MKAAAAPAEPSLESARSQPQSNPANNTLTQTSTAEKVANKLLAVHDSHASTVSDEKMGSEQSRPKRDRDRDSPSLHKAKSAPTPEKPSPSPQSQPVNVPSAAREEPGTSSKIDIAASEKGPADVAPDDYFMPPSQFSRPPRLPLPIEEEVHTPGSPIIDPTDLKPDIAQADVLKRSLSEGTLEEEDLGDEFQGPQDVPTVPTIIEWEGPGEKVYVTGTFAGWNRKFRLHRK